jgi:hypothetical protein
MQRLSYRNVPRDSRQSASVWVHDTVCAPGMHSRLYAGEVGLTLKVLRRFSAGENATASAL